MNVFRIEASNGHWTLYKAHGYKPILEADDQAELIEHALALAQGRGLVIRFPAGEGYRELRLGEFDTEEGDADAI